MEKLFLPPKIGNTLAAVTMTFAGMTLYQALDSYGQMRYFEGQAYSLEASGHNDAADIADVFVDDLRDNAVANSMVSLGFLCVSGVSIYLGASGRRNQYS